MVNSNTYDHMNWIKLKKKHIVNFSFSMKKIPIEKQLHIKLSKITPKQRYEVNLLY